jgi:hypothetical protein
LCGCFESFFLYSLPSTAEERVAQTELREFRHFIHENIRLEGEPRLPPAYLPSAFACLALFGAITLHILFHLMCHWSAAFRAAAFFEPASLAAPIDERCVVVVQPPQNRGQSMSVGVRRSALTGQVLIEFQRQTYFYQPPSVRAQTSHFECALCGHLCLHGF